MVQTFFFYDLETSGLSPQSDRIMQFAGQRTDLNFNIIGEPINLLIQLSNDTLPSPSAIFVTKITPQKTLTDGITEAEFAKIAQTEIFTPGTIAIGYNTIRFDDEFMRYLFWRNFYDPYEWTWKDNRSRFDLLDLVRLTRALRPEGINWPVSETGKATNRLELLTKLNNIDHLHAHDALSDVFASIAVAKLIHAHQPDLFNYLFKLRNKKTLQRLINLEHKKPFVYTSGRYATEFHKTTIAFPLTSARNGNLLVFDLRYNLDEILRTRSSTPNSSPSFHPIVKEFHFNKCPAVAPLSVLSKQDGWRKIKLTPKIIQKNLKSLLSHPEFAESMREIAEQIPDFTSPDPESALYEGFLNDADRANANAVLSATPSELADFSPAFLDERLPHLLIHYKARNFPTTLTESEAKIWQTYRKARLQFQSTKFKEELAILSTQDKSLAKKLEDYFASISS